MKTIIALSIALAAQVAFAGRTVQHQHKCPGIFRDLNICANYEGFPENVSIASAGETPFTVVLYTFDSAYSASGERQYVDVDGTLSAELMMAHSSNEHMSMPVTLKKVGVGKYQVNGAYFTMPGQWGLLLNLERPGYPLMKQTGLYVYIYPDDVN